MLLTIYLGRCLPGYESPAMAAQTHGALDMAGQSNIPECGTPSLTSTNAIMDVSLPHSNAEDTSQWAMAGQAAMDVSQDDAGCINPRLLPGTAHQPSPPPTAYGGDCPMLGDEDMDQDESHRIPTSMPDPVTECPTVDKGTEGAHLGESMDKEMDDVADETTKVCKVMKYTSDANKRYFSTILWTTAMWDQFLAQKNPVLKVAMRAQFQGQMKTMIGQLEKAILA